MTNTTTRTLLFYFLLIFLIGSLIQITRLQEKLKEVSGTCNLVITKCENTLTKYDTAFIDYNKRLEVCQRRLFVTRETMK